LLPISVSGGLTVPIYFYIAAILGSLLSP
jgi:hypothetical protein